VEIYQTLERSLFMFTHTLYNHPIIRELQVHVWIVDRTDPCGHRLVLTVTLPVRSEGQMVLKALEESLKTITGCRPRPGVNEPCLATAWLYCQHLHNPQRQTVQKRSHPESQMSLKPSQMWYVWATGLKSQWRKEEWEKKRLTDKRISCPWEYSNHFLCYDDPVEFMVIILKYFDQRDSSEMLEFCF